MVIITKTVSLLRPPLSSGWAADPLLDAWRGARRLAQTAATTEALYVTQKMYMEFGSDYLNEHLLSNPVWK